MKLGVLGDLGDWLATLAPLGIEVARLDRAASALAADLGALLIADDAMRAPLTPAVAAFAAKGGPVLGVGGGFSALCQWGLLDGEVALETTAVAVDVHWVVEGRPTPFTQAIPAGRQLCTHRGPVAYRFAHGDVDRLEAEARVVARYTTPDGEVCPTGDLTGSVHNIAGICNGTGNIVGVALAPAAVLIESALAWQRGAPARV